jgi:sporulation protein YhbH
MGILKNKLPWDLHQRGLRDSQRHAKKIKDAIKKNLHHIISQENIITTDGKKTTKVPIRYLDSYYFRYGKMRDGVRHGDGEPGDILRPAKMDNDDDGDGTKPGTDIGMDVYEAEISVDELTELMLADLGLPFLEDKDRKQVITKHVEYTDIRKRGPMSNWAKRRTIVENIRRNAQEGNPPKFGNLREEDMRFRSWNEHIERHSNAVVYLMMDRSGSMDEHKRYLCKATFWWLCRFLEKMYDNVETVFIAHDYDAKVVPEKDFFTISNDGGTRCSSAYELAWKDIQESRPQNSWNVYCFHFSDGDNGTEDSGRCAELVKQMLERINMFAYGEVEWKNPNWNSSSSLMDELENIDNPHMMTAILEDKEDVYPTLQQFLNKEIGSQDDDEPRGN